MPTTANDPTRNPNALLSDGTFRGSRLPAALAGDYVSVDEKAAADWIEFARRLAAQLNFVNTDNLVAGNWSPFYEKQPAVATARLLAWPLERLGQRLAEHRELIEDRQGTIPVEQLLDSLFDLLTSAVVSLDGLTDRFAPGTPLRERAEALIEHQLAPAFRRWLAYYRAGAPVYFAALGVDEVPDYLRDAYAAGGRLFATQELIDGNAPLSDRWTAGLSWTDYLNEVGTDDTVYGTTPTAAGAEVEILHAVGHVFFHQIYGAFTSSALHLRAAAQMEWQRLNDAPDNAPHLALLLAFLQLRERQREMLNGLTDRHLNFYYRRVLRTRPAPARPPRALLYLEARSNLPPTYLPAGTAFRGGKDEATGTERTFLSQGAVTVTEATIAEKRTVFRVADDPSVYDFPGENRKVYTAADAGRYYSSSELEDYPFGQQMIDGNHLVADMEPARLGLAIASHYLYLREGSRTVTLRFQGMAGVPGIPLKLYLTTEEGWHELTATLTGNEVSFTLAAEAPPILPYDEEVHEQGLATDLPVLRLELEQKENVLTDNQQLFARSFSRVYIGLTVNGIRQLAMSGSAGSIDPSAPFHPFGPTPRQGDVLIIGNNEVFQKRYADATYRWSWADSSGAGDVRFDQSTLEGGTFGSPERTNLSLNDGELTDSIFPDDVIALTFAPDVPYAAGMARGYVRFKLRGDWGHADYPTELAGWAASDPDTRGVVPSPPYSPLFADFSLDYSLNLDAYDGRAAAAQHGKHRLFHLTPFGSDPLPASGNRRFLPTILPQSGAALGADAGAMYLGIAAWAPGSQLSVLFQIIEGTADPLLEKPEEHLRWHYLNQNQWEHFPTDKLSDGTDGLLRSGLVRLDLPAETEPTNTRFGDGLQWIRLSVQEKVNAVNRLLGVHAHGVEVVQSFTAEQSATDEPLPAGTIAKLTFPLPGIGAVNQPYPTFAGAAPENRDSYFTRLSERLRHKNRGITEWDVEHLVLGAFPEVERVICLQHVEFEPGEVAGSYTYHELSAGHFTVLPLGRSGESGLRPYVSLSSREAIEAYLRARISCHATLHVRNPLFEEVVVKADVKYLHGTDITWAEGQVQLDLIDYISPWHDGGLGGLDFTAEVQQSGVVNFLEELHYVDYVKNLVLLHSSDITQNENERLRPTKLVSVLASAPTHLIGTIKGEADPRLTEVCHPPRRGPRRSTVTITDNPVIL